RISIFIIKIYQMLVRIVFIV
ncbi:hypothetical protein, partial [Plasmodium yoelii yoelii]